MDDSICQTDQQDRGHRLFRSIALLLILIGSAFLANAGLSQQSTSPPKKAGPAQPIPFSHREHVGMKLECNFCHANPDHGVQMTLPPVARCMTCHATMAKDKATIQTLTQIANAGEQVQWVQVYGIPGFVFWSHGTHLQAKVQCKDCHGDVSQMDVMFRATNVTTMGGCVECHKQRNGPTGCMSCHEEQSSHLLIEPLPPSLRRSIGLPVGM